MDRPFSTDAPIDQLDRQMADMALDNQREGQSQTQTDIAAVTSVAPGSILPSTQLIHEGHAASQDTPHWQPNYAPIQQNPSPSATQSPNMQRELTEINRIPLDVLQRLKEEAGLHDKDVPSMTLEEREWLINRWKGMVDELLGSPPVPNSSDSHSQPSPLHNLNTVNQPFSINIAPMDQSLRMSPLRMHEGLYRPPLHQRTPRQLSVFGDASLRPEDATVHVYADSSTALPTAGPDMASPSHRETLSNGNDATSASAGMPAPSPSGMIMSNGGTPAMPPSHPPVQPQINGDTLSSDFLQSIASQLDTSTFVGDSLFRGAELGMDSDFEHDFNEWFNPDPRGLGFI